MARKNIFEILSETIDVIDEMDKIIALFNSELIYKPDFRSDYVSVTVEAYVDDNLFYKWKARNRCINCNSMKKSLGISDLRFYRFEDNLTYLEYIVNILDLFDKGKTAKIKVSRDYMILCENINALLEHFNHEEKCFPEEQMVLIVEMNPASTAVAEILDDKDLAFDVINYNHYLLKGDIQKKRKILVSLGHKIEARRKELRAISSSLESNIFFMLNSVNIRHNNISDSDKGHYNQYIASLTDEQVEELYDETYQMILLAFLELDNIDRCNRLKQLKENMGKINVEVL